MTKEKTEAKPYQNPLDIGLAADRINFGVGRKVTDGNYGSYDFHCSISTDVRLGETPRDALIRSMNFVEGIVNFKINQKESGKLSY